MASAISGRNVSETQMNQAMEMDRKTDEKEEMKRLKEDNKYHVTSDRIEQDQQQFQFFMDPMMKELEDQVAVSTEILDKLNIQMAEDRAKRIKDQQTAHIPEALKGEGQEMKSIMRSIETMLVFGDDSADADAKEETNKPESDQHNEEQNNDEEEEDDDEEDEDDDEDDEEGKQYLLPALDEHGRAAVLAHSLAGYASLLGEDHLKKFTSKITSDCQLWLSRLFRFTDASAVFCEEEKDGLARICRLAFYQKYPKYATEGFEALYSRPPVIYVSAAAKSDLSTYLCLQLGLPMSCICSVPCHSGSESSSTMDVAMLEKLIQDDIAAAKTPTLLIAYAGTPLTGEVDSLDQLQDICKKNSIWLHVEGNNLATLTLVSVPTSVLSAKSGDSITVCMGKWLGIPGLPYATIFKTSDPALVHAAGLNTFNPQIKLNCLPLWICLQSLGHDGIVERIKSSCDLSELLHKELTKIKPIRQVNHNEKKENNSDNSIRSLISRAISALLVFEMVSPTVLFRYTEESDTGLEMAPYSATLTTEELDDSSSIYFDALNVWLGETLQAENPGVDLSVVEVQKEGICIRFSPLDSAQAKGTTTDEIQTLLKSLKTQVAILDATVLSQEKFKSVVQSENGLRLLEMPNWAGLGVVQYIPESWRNKGDDFPEDAKKEIHFINTELVQQLKSTDTAFSLGFSEDDVACVKFGLITEDTVIEELIDLVLKSGKEVEESSKYLERMAEMVRQGIEAANKDLQKENESKLIKEGVLRQVPLVGSLLNWWSPPPKDVVKGRAFNLSSGQISTTENLYKYHMQFQEDTNTATKPPPTRQLSSQSTQSTSSERTAGDVKANLTNELSSPPSSPKTENTNPLEQAPVEQAQEAT